MTYPKCDLHRHFGGSISCFTVSKIREMPLEDVQKNMTYLEDNVRDYEAFFKKFTILDDIKWNMANTELSVQDVVWNLAQEGIHYAEIKFSINKYLKHIGMTPERTITWIAYLFDKYASHWGIEIDLILCLKHNMDKELQIAISNTIENDYVNECIAGIDIVGNENFFNADFYVPIYEKWHSAGKACMAHVGEVNLVDNVRDAIFKLKVDRICHGIAAVDDKEIAAASRDKLICFDVCLTSNIYTGVATEDHPVTKMIDNGFIISIGTDDPVILNTTIDKEYSLFQKITKASDDDIDDLKESTLLWSAKEIIKRKAIKNNS